MNTKSAKSPQVVGGTDEQRKDYKFFNEHLPEYLKDKRLVGKHLVIAGQTVRGFFDTFDAALKSALASYTFGQFIIQEVVDENEIVHFLSPAF